MSSTGNLIKTLVLVIVAFLITEGKILNQEISSDGLWKPKTVTDKQSIDKPIENGAFYFKSMPVKSEDAVNGLKFSSIEAKELLRKKRSPINTPKPTTTESINKSSKVRPTTIEDSNEKITENSIDFPWPWKRKTTTTVKPKPSEPTDGPKTTKEPKPTDGPKTTKEPQPTDTPTSTNTSKPTDGPKTTKEPQPTDTPTSTNTPKPTTTESPPRTTGTSSPSTRRPNEKFHIKIKADILIRRWFNK